MALSADQKLVAGRLMAMQAMPYFTSGLLMLVPRKAPGLGTFGVSDRGVMFWDPAKAEQWTVPEIAAVLIHELNHVLREHGRRCKDCGAHAANHKMVWNFAADAESNDDIREAGLTLPGDCIYPESFGSKPGRLAEEYYQDLLKQQPPPSGGEGGDGDGQGDQDQQGKGGGKGQQPGPGWCGSGAGRALPGEQEGQGDSRSQAEMESMRRQVAEAVKNHASQGRGTVPAGLLRWAEALLGPPVVDWRTKLARAIRRAVAYRAGAVDFKYDRPSRRQGAFGWGVNQPVLPAVRMPLPRVGIGVDTSGSVGQVELEQALTEAQGVLSSVGAEVNLVVCDAEVHANTRVRTVADITKNLKGGGGTDFAPVFEAADAMKPRPNVFIFFTDGQAPWNGVHIPCDMSIIVVGLGPYQHECPPEIGEWISIPYETPK